MSRDITKSNPAIVKIARQMDSIQFDNMEATRAKWREGAMADRRWKHAYRFMGGVSWDVRLMIRGNQITVGRGRDSTIATRYADAVSVYFWGYNRKSAEREIQDSDLNYSVAQAKHDIETNDFLRQMLQGIEAILQAKGELIRKDDCVSCVKKEIPAVLAQVAVCKRAVRAAVNEGKLPIVLLGFLEDTQEEFEKVCKSILTILERQTEPDPAERAKKLAIIDAIEQRKEWKKAEAEQIEHQFNELERARIKAELDRQAKAIDPTRNSSNIFTPEDVDKLLALDNKPKP